MASEIMKSIQVICDSKGLKAEAVIEAIEFALAAAFRKDFGSKNGNYHVKFDPETAGMQIWDIKTVVPDYPAEEIERALEETLKRREAARLEGRELTEADLTDLINYNPKTDLMLTEAKEIKKDAEVGDVIEIPQEVPGDFGRMAAQTAKQVIIQKLREAERVAAFGEFEGEAGTVITGVVQRRDRVGNVIVDLGKINGFLPIEEQNKRESYRPGARLRFYILSAVMGQRGPEITLSRSSNKMVESVFEQEIPEIQDGAVVIKAVSRDAGNRSKVAVQAVDQNVDPIGACIGQRGGRITTIIAELGEKVDIILWHPDKSSFLKNALSPAKVSEVVWANENEATVKVPADQFSLAIGRGGQNVRLAADLVGVKVTVVEEGGDGQAVSSDDEEVLEEIADVEVPKADEPIATV